MFDSTIENQGTSKIQPILSRSYKVLALSFGGIFSMIGGIVFTMIAVRNLTVHEYATIRQTFLTYDFVVPIILLGLPNALYFFLPRTKEDKRGLLIDITVILTLLGILFGLFILLGGNKILAMRFDNPDLNQTLLWLSPYPLFLMPIACLASALVIAEKVKILTAYNTLTSLAGTITSICALLISKSFAAPIISKVLLTAISLPIGIYIMFKAFPGNIRWPRYKSMLEMTLYSAPLGLASMLGTITIQMHAVIVSAMCTPEDFAVYINGAMEVPIIGVITGAIVSVIIADMSNECARGNKLEALNIFHKASIKSAILLIPTMIYFLIAAEPFITFMFTDNYKESVEPFLIYLTILPARIVVYGAALMALGMSKEILFRSFFDLLINGILSFVFVGILGYKGAAIGLVCTLYLWTIPYNLHKISKGYNVSWKSVLPWKEIGIITLIGLVASPIAKLFLFLLKEQFLFLQLSLSAIAYSLVCAYFFIYLKFIFLPRWAEKILPNKLIRTIN